MWLPALDLVRTGRAPQVLRIGDADLKVGKLPGERLHRRRLIKSSAPVVLIEVLPDPRSHCPADVQPPGPTEGGVAEAAVDGGTVRLAFHPSLPDLTALPDGARRDGSWSVSADAGRLMGGRWFVQRNGDQVQAGLDVTERWRPCRLPLLMRVVTTVGAFRLPHNSELGTVAGAAGVCSCSVRASLERITRESAWLGVPITA